LIHLNSLISRSFHRWNDRSSETTIMDIAPKKRSLAAAQILNVNLLLV
jgi:hypothetical protein